ncbi:MAG: Ribulose-phosphate 3-epimerase [Candidatus Woesebacteria bacterium GW2011_GWB1_38_5b]|uniref:Ribulose-phosphate 3-epimerase n=1 Tax=Candidatus Woesebacteria bacterium GW2011_GWB1_38_5b TaxID=1618569 RepID=A0A0G0KHF3_9BACT|nr:MAG: Ribulose-phosphate 3-epimerase [Candidatus Woesebacteria bacterium GW2011_GWB1_38_5b]OGH48269.1 MAG: hypothetical protein A3A51_00510 [Candidatus Levybacteria bacterium RIFCSPLOWO2_01_FULL_39_10]
MIIPAILEKSFEEIEKKIEITRQFSKKVHIDFIDGKFAKNTTFFDPSHFKKYSNDLDLEAHLMVDEPVQYLTPLSQAGFKRIIGHVEKMGDQVDFIAKAEVLGAVGLALDLETPISEIEVSYDDLDLILLMSVKAGESGQIFDEGVVSKIKKLRSLYLGEIEMDGGINDKTLSLAKQAGATTFCTTSFIFTDDPWGQFKKLVSLL